MDDLIALGVNPLSLRVFPTRKGHRATCSVAWSVQEIEADAGTREEAREALADVVRTELQLVTALAEREKRNRVLFADEARASLGDVSVRVAALRTYPQKAA